VATIIHAVSAALICDVPAKAGVAHEMMVKRIIGAASVAARHESAPIWYFPTRISLPGSASLAPLPAATEVFRVAFSFDAFFSLELVARSRF
jgi:hypothetical protein